MEKESDIIMQFLSTCGVVICDNINEIDGTQIPREMLLCEKRYETAKQLIPDLRNILSSSYMTSLQSNAEKNQAWPLINLVRQVLKIYNYKMKPIRMSNGYTKDGKKKYKRAYVIEKLKDVNNINIVTSED